MYARRTTATLLALVALGTALQVQGWRARARQSDGFGDGGFHSEAQGEAGAEASSFGGGRDGFPGNSLSGAHASATAGAKSNSDAFRLPPLSPTALDTKPLSLNGAGDTIKSSLASFTAPSQTARELSEKERAVSAAGAETHARTAVDWAKLLFNPIELAKAICVQFNLPFDGFVKTLNKPLLFGLEATLQPVVASLKIIDSVFAPDHCRLRFMCELGTYLRFMRESITQLTPGLFTGSKTVEALSKSIVSEVDCDAVYVDCKMPHLRLPFLQLQQRQYGEQASQSSQYAASQSSSVSGSSSSSVSAGGAETSIFG